MRKANITRLESVKFGLKEIISLYAYMGENSRITLKRLYYFALYEFHATYLIAKELKRLWDVQNVLTFAFISTPLES